MKKMYIILGIMMCSCYFPFIAFLSIISGILNGGSSDIFLVPIFVIIMYVFGIFFVFLGTKENEQIKSSEIKQLLTTCSQCKTQYPFTKNPYGDTQVFCPKCGSKGIIK